MSNSFINWNDLQFKTVFYNIKKTHQTNHQNQTLSGVFCIQGTVPDIKQCQRFWGFLKEWKIKI